MSLSVGIDEVDVSRREDGTGNIMISFYIGYFNNSILILTRFIVRELNGLPFIHHDSRLLNLIMTPQLALVLEKEGEGSSCCCCGEDC